MNLVVSAAAAYASPAALGWQVLQEPKALLANTLAKPGMTSRNVDVEQEERLLDEDEIDFDAEDEDEDYEPPSPWKRRRPWLIAILAAAVACAFIMAGVIAYQSREQDMAAARIGDVSLGPQMTLSDLRRALGSETTADRSVDAGISIDNAIDYQFGHGLVVATCLGKDPRSVTGRAVPITITIMPAFRGTVCGVHTSDPLAKAVAIIRDNFPGASTASDFDTEHEINLDGVWTLTFEPQTDKSGQMCAGGMILKDSQWNTSVEDNSP